MNYHHTPRAEYNISTRKASHINSSPMHPSPGTFLVHRPPSASGGIRRLIRGMNISHLDSIRDTWSSSRRRTLEPWSRTWPPRHGSLRKGFHQGISNLWLPGTHARILDILVHTIHLSGRSRTARTHRQLRTLSMIQQARWSTGRCFRLLRRTA